MIWVSNIGGNDDFIDYAHSTEALQPEFAGHAPVNFHAFAAATDGTFSNRAFNADDREHKIGLVLITKRFDQVLKEIKNLKQHGLEIWVSWKECGRHQIANTLVKPKQVDLYREILSAADKVIHASTDPALLAGDHSVEMMTPYPVDLDAWDISIPVDDRRGVFIGTRELKVSSRNHLYAISSALHLAIENDTHVTVVNRDRKFGMSMLNAAFKEPIAQQQLKIVDGRLPYLEYLNLIAKHRLVFQCDRSGVPGQVAGDTLLCRSLCIGGDSLIERNIFDIKELAAELLCNDKVYQQQIDRTQSIAMERLSFGAFRSRLE